MVDINSTNNTYSMFIYDQASSTVTYTPSDYKCNNKL